MENTVPAVTTETKINPEKTTLTPTQLEEARLILAKTDRTNNDDLSEATNESVSDNKQAAGLVSLVPSPPASPDTQAINGATNTNILVSNDEYELLQQLKQEKHQWAIDSKVKGLGNEYALRRNTLILRRALKLYPNLIPKEDVVAYSEIYKMREAVTEKGKKVQVPDEEILAYVELEARNLPTTLEAIMASAKTGKE